MPIVTLQLLADKQEIISRYDVLPIFILILSTALILSTRHEIRNPQALRPYPILLSTTGLQIPDYYSYPLLKSF